MLLSVMLTMLLPVVMLPINIILGTQEKKYKGLYCFLIAFGLAAIAYNFRPISGQNTDIMRHLINMENVGEMTLADVDGHRIFSGLPGYYLLLKLFSFAKSEYLLQTVSTLIGYSICLWITRKIDNDNDKKISFLVVFMFLSCVSLLGFCSGIRQYMVFTFFLMFFYFETFEKKHRFISWIAYFLLITLHTSVTFIIMLRIFCEIFRRAKGLKAISAILLFWSLAQNAVVTFLANNFTGNAIADKIIELSGFYEENPSKIIIPMFTWRLILLIFCVAVNYYLLKKKNNDSKISEKYLLFAFLSCMFAFGGITSYDVFSRFSIFAIIMTIPVIPTFFKEIDVKYKEITRWFLTFFSIFVLIYNINQYLTFNFNNPVEILTTNIFTFLGAI